jgi:hypothetical protein
MRKIVDGKVYNTETALQVCDISPSGFSRGDFQYEDTYLYKSPKGTFFVSGIGGPMTRWAQSEGQSGRRGGSGLEVIDIDEARALCERHGTAAEFEAAFGEPEEG